MTKARDLANAGTALTSVSATELGYLDGVTSAVQTQINSKQAVVSGVNDTEIGYLDGVTSAIQTQLDSKAVYPSQTGNSGKYLTTDGSTPSWGTVSAGFNPTLTYLGAFNISVNNGVKTVTGLGGYKYLYLYFNLLTDTNNITIDMQFNQDSGANYYYAGINGDTSSAVAFSSGTFSSAPTSYIRIGKNQASGSTGLRGFMQIMNTGGTTPKVFQYTGMGGGTTGAGYSATGHYSGTSALSSVTFIASNNYITDGSSYLYVWGAA